MPHALTADLSDLYFGGWRQLQTALNGKGKSDLAISSFSYSSTEVYDCARLVPIQDLHPKKSASQKRHQTLSSAAVSAVEREASE
jgi:hypothetical protein